MCFFYILCIFPPALLNTRRRSDLCVILHAQAKGITANPLCSRRSFSAPLAQSVVLLFANRLRWCRLSHGAVCHLKSCQRRAQFVCQYNLLLHCSTQLAQLSILHIFLAADSLSLLCFSTSSSSPRQLACV